MTSRIRLCVVTSPVGLYAAGMGKDADEEKEKKDDPKHSVEDDKATGKQPGDIDPSKYPPRDDK